MLTKSEFAIVGGGVAGLTAGIALEQLSRDFCLFEQTKEVEGIGAGFGLAANAMRALEILGLRHEVEKIGYYLGSFAILDQRGNILVNPNTSTLSDKYQQQNFAIHRADLHLYLLSKLQAQRLQLGKQAIELVQKSNSILLSFADGSKHECKYLIIADGVKSPLRQQLVPTSSPRYAGYSCWRATIDNSEIQLSLGTETWGKDGRFGMTPLVNNRIYWYACINGPRNHPAFSKYRVADLQKQFADYHDPIPTLLANTRDEDLIWSDIIDIAPLKNLAYGNILLIGDAGHATTPNMGQGACQALEDVVVLQDELKKKTDVVAAFKSFEHRRLARTKYITDTSKMIGQVSQWENPIMISVRNTMMKMLPAKANQKALEKLFKQDFMTLNT